MQHYTYRPRGVCSQQIDFDLDNGKLHDVRFVSGCNGNLKAIGRLLEGQEATEAVRILKGNTCGMRNTSCADQLAAAVRKAYNESTGA